MAELELETEELEEQENKQEWLSFHLADASYAIDILRVFEIRVWEGVTRIPDSEDYVMGLMNLRGSIVPIIDLRKRLGLEVSEYSHTTVVLILSVKHSSGDKIIGMVVDAISDVLESNQEGKVRPEYDLAIDKKYVKGITDYKEKMVVLLDVDTVLDLSD